MSDIEAKQDVKEATMEAVVIRADGTREDLGVVSAYYKNPVKQAAFNLKQKMKGK